MPFAAVVSVRLDRAADAAHRLDILRQFVLPPLEALPGFRRVSFMTDARTGTGFSVAEFDTEEQARHALGILAPDNGPEVLEAHVCAVELDAGHHT
ncbi:MAG TPA: hypothetical protein VGG38_08195 [Acidimicrobiales bacterium]|jgi:hypothetical protein